MTEPTLPEAAPNPSEKDAVADDSSVTETPESNEPPGRFLRAFRELPTWARRSGIALCVAVGVLLVGGITGTSIAVHNFTAGEVLKSRIQEGKEYQSELSSDISSLKSDNLKLVEQVDKLDQREAALKERETLAQNKDGELAQRSEEISAREDAVGAAEEAKKSTSFDSGTFIVGTDIQPGTYRNSGTSDCYWARLSGLGGSVYDIIANDNANGQAVVRIAASDAGFTSSRCGTWTLLQ